MSTKDNTHYHNYNLTAKVMTVVFHRELGWYTLPSLQHASWLTAGKRGK